MSNQKIATNDEQSYSDLLHQAVTEITVARTSLARQVNSTVMSAYRNIGKLLFAEQLEGGYGSGIINRLSVDLKSHFPDMGLSPRNLWDMKRFYERYCDGNEKLLRNVAVLPWRSMQTKSSSVRITWDFWALPSRPLTSFPIQPIQPIIKAGMSVVLHRK